MKALEVCEHSGPSSVNLVERDMPEVKGDRVLIRVTAAGVNFADVAQSRGLYPGGPQAPYLGGLEAAGVVERAGPDSPIPVGTRVMGLGSRAFAEYVCWPAGLCFPTPDHWTDTQAAAFPVQWLTAHACLRTVGRLEAGDNVLIHAAAGGVGQAAVHLARHFGAWVIGTAGSASKCEQVLARGAHAAINYRDEDFVSRVREITEGDGIDLCLEMVGGDTFRKNLRVLRPFGRMVVYGAASNEPASVANVPLIFNPVEVLGYHLMRMMSDRPDLFGRQWTEMVSLIAQGVVQPEEPSVAPLEEGAEVLGRLERRETTGKWVLTP